MEVSYAASKVTKIAKKVLFKIMKQISNSSNKECYEHLYIESQEPRLSMIDNGWSEINQASEELNNDEKDKIFWNVSENK